MGRDRKRVPVGLHSEFSEYSSLIRALETSETLGEVSHLTEHQASAGDGGEQSTKEPDEGKRRVSGTKSRWPLLAGDVDVPEWGIEDEIKVLASRALKAHLSIEEEEEEEGTTGPDDPTSDDGEDEVLDAPFLNAVTMATSAHLSQILALLAAHVPLTGKTTQDRIRPIGWESVLNIVWAHELYDEEFV
jgi:hypothetical protein